MAVYTKISHLELEKFISNYNIGTLKTFTAIEAGIQNSNYFIITDIAKYVLTIYENGITPVDLLFFLGIMEHFSKQGILCPSIVADKGGNSIGKIQNKPCAIASFLSGKELSDIHNQHVEELGVNIARMHLASYDLPLYRKNDLSINGWIDIFNSIRSRVDEFEPGLEQEIESILCFLQQSWPSDLPSGIIHADIFPDNVFFIDDKLVGVIDFYFACNDAFIYDLAICVNSWCFEQNGDFNKIKAKLLIASYNNTRKLCQEEFTALPILCLGSSLRFLLTRLDAWLNRNDEAIVRIKDPREYLCKMRFHSRIKSYEEYGLEVHDYNKI